MPDKPDNQGAISRRECLGAAGAVLVAVAQPALAAERQTGPKGHRRTAPAFRQVSLEK